MMKTWKYLDTIYCALNTRLTVIVDEFAFTIKTASRNKLLVSIIYQNVQITK